MYILLSLKFYKLAVYQHNGLVVHSKICVLVFVPFCYNSVFILNFSRDQVKKLALLCILLTMVCYLLLD